LQPDQLASLAIAAIVLLSTTLIAPQAMALVPAALVLLLLLARGLCPLRRVLALAWRLKWFYLSLVFFFGWLPPGSGASGWERVLPSATGLAEAGVRIAALLLVVGWVTWLTAAFDRAAQVRGLSRWLDLLRPLGLRGEAFAQQLFLTLELFEGRRLEYRSFRERFRGSRWGRLKAGREFLIAGLDQALAGPAMPEPRTVAGPSGGGSRNSARSLSGQVALLWLAVLTAGGILFATTGAGG
jgi:hypothetical protein